MAKDFLRGPSSVRSAGCHGWSPLPVAVRHQRASWLSQRCMGTHKLWKPPRLRGASEVLFREPAVLLQLGWTPVQIRQGSNGRHRHPVGRQAESLPCHPDTLRDALRRVQESAWLQVQAAGVKALYQRQLVHGKVYAVDGSGLGKDFRLPRIAQRGWETRKQNHIVWEQDRFRLSEPKVPEKERDVERKEKKCAESETMGRKKP